MLYIHKSIKVYQSFDAVAPSQFYGLRALWLVWHHNKSPTDIPPKKDRIVSINKTIRSGGLEGIRTLDLCDANAALSQLSYEPICTCAGQLT